MVPFRHKELCPIFLAPVLYQIDFLHVAVRRSRRMRADYAHPKIISLTVRAKDDWQPPSSQARPVPSPREKCLTLTNDDVSFMYA